MTTSTISALSIEIEKAPKYRHDCNSCTFLGNVAIPKKLSYSGKSADLYHCKQGGSWPTVIARLSSSPEDYQSGLGSAQYSCQEELVRGQFKTAKEALVSVVDNADHLVTYLLPLAALLAFEKGLLKEEQLAPKSFFVGQ